MAKPSLLFYLALASIGFAEALPLPLMGSTLSIWLTEEGFTKQGIGFFSLLIIPLSLKIFWSPVVDRLSVPFFQNESRKGWVLISMWGIALSLLSMSFLRPHESPATLALCILFLSLCTGCLFMVSLSYELESLPQENYSTASGYVHLGYRLGIAAAGAGALYLSDVKDWPFAFQALSLVIVLGSALIFLLPEPLGSYDSLQKKKRARAQYTSFFQGLFQELCIQPGKAFFQNPQWKQIIFLIIVFKGGDQLITSMKGPFYLSLGFSKTDLAQAAKLFGLLATFLGAYLGGIVLRGKNPLLCVSISSTIHACSLLCFEFLSLLGPSFFGLYATVALENITGGMAMTIFIRFLWSVCDRRCAATQYAILWSLFTSKGNIASFLGGALAHVSSWDLFFLIVSFLGLGSSLLAMIFVSRDRLTQKRTIGA
jgi:PAT family beta-lactamase induction signal transducer AmpG